MEKTWTWNESQASRYDTLVTEERGLYYARYHDLLDLVVVRCRVRAGDRVLDIGTGTGELARRLAHGRGCHVVGLDPSPAMIEAALRKADGNGRGVRVFEVAEAPFLEIPYPDRSFNAVASTQAFHHIHERHKPAAVREMARVLKDGGRLAIGDPMFRHRAALDAALEQWPDELEEEYFATLDTLAPMFHAAGLSFEAEQLTDINWVVWGEKG
ncbi:MAG: class I SAM-dependent methyltransferase [Anaerolineae bacterium]|nr:class I SAM-dependent methyltransferase [Anaerolineae bacterium]